MNIKKRFAGQNVAHVSLSLSIHIACAMAYACNASLDSAQHLLPGLVGLASCARACNVCVQCVGMASHARLEWNERFYLSSF